MNYCSFDPIDFLLTFGDHNRKKESEPFSVETRIPSKIFVHSDFNDYTYENDLALLFVSEPVPFSNNIQPICLPEPNRPLVVGTMGFATGWGYDAEDGGSKPSILQEVLLPIHNHKKCNQLFLEANLDEALSDVFICAGFKEGGKDACEVKTRRNRISQFLCIKGLNFKLPFRVIAAVP